MAGRSVRSCAERSTWKCTSRYRGIDAGIWHSTNASLSLMSRVTTDVKRRVPVASRQVSRPGIATRRRLPMRSRWVEGAAAERFIEVLQGCGHHLLYQVPDLGWHRWALPCSFLY